MTGYVGPALSRGTPPISLQDTSVSLVLPTSGVGRKGVEEPRGARDLEGQVIRQRTFMSSAIPVLD